MDNLLQVPQENGEPGLSIPNKVIDQLRYLISHIQREREFPARLALVSALRGEGVSYLAYALAATLASDSDEQIGIVQLNWHWPQPAPFTQPNTPGLAQVVQGQARLEDILISTGLPNLTVLPAGQTLAKQRPALARGETLRHVIAEASARFDHLILDIPAVLATSDAVALAGLGDGCCMVVRQGVTGQGDIKAALDEINHLPVLGVILNQMHYATPASLTRLVLGQS